MGRFLFWHCVNFAVLLLLAWEESSWADGQKACSGQDCARDLGEVDKSSKKSKGKSSQTGPTANSGSLSVSSGPNVTIIPPFLQFKSRPLCMPAVEKVEVINTSDNDELHLFAVSTDTVHFHPSSFKQTVGFSSVSYSQGSFPHCQVVPVKGKTVISVVFVPRLLGAVEGTLIIETSVGGFLYQVHGEGIANPYNLTPFLGAKIPVGVPFNPPIKIYNPKDQVLHVKEVFTNEGFLHLTLPKASGGGDYGSAGLWEINPRHTNTIINLSFQSNVPGKHTGFVHVKTDIDNMIIPVEIHVMKGGIHRSPEELDFGTLTSSTDKRSLSVSLLNSGPQPVLVSDIYASSPDSHLSITFKKGTLLMPGVELSVATVVYTGRTEGQFMGKLLLRTNDSNPAGSRVQVPYKARVLHGSLGYDLLNASFAVGSPPFKPIVQSLTLINRFPISLQFTAATIADPNFHVVQFTSDSVVPPGGSAPPLLIMFQANSTDMLFTTHLSLSTNASVLLIPLHCYHGRLKVSSAEEESIDFGLLGVNEARSRSFNLSNPNPVRVPVYGYNTTLAGLEVRLESISGTASPVNMREVINPRGRGSTSSTAASKGGSSADLVKGEQPLLVLDPGQYAIFTAELFTTKEEENSGEVLFKTFFETMSISVKYKSLHGTLSFIPALIRFEASFPGRLIRKPIHAKSTYSCPLNIISISSSDVRLVPTLTNTTLLPNVRMTIGHVVFDASKGPVEENYMALEELDSDKDKSLVAADVQAMRSREKLWDELVAKGAVDVRAMLTLNTDVAMGCTLSVRASLMNPTILKNETLGFGLTQIGSSNEQGVHIHNPADHPVYVQLVEFLEGDGAGACAAGEDGSGNCTAGGLAAGSAPASHGKGGKGGKKGSSAAASDAKESGVAVENPAVDNAFIIPAAASQGIVVPAHTDAFLGPIWFLPKAQKKYSTTLYLKNNLTFLQSVIVNGEGGTGEFVFKQSLDGYPLGGSGSSFNDDSLVVLLPPSLEEQRQRGNDKHRRDVVLSTLRFDLNASHLGFVWDSKHSNWVLPPHRETLPERSFVRTFVAANVGNLPVEVKGMNINGAGCSQYGFSLRNCEAFTLEPQETINIVITFQPDFSASVVKRDLFVYTSQGILRFPLLATVPHEMLPICLDAQPSSAWQQTVRWWLVQLAFLGFVVCVVMVSREFSLTSGAPTASEQSSLWTPVPTAPRKPDERLSFSKKGKDNSSRTTVAADELDPERVAAEKEASPSFRAGRSESPPPLEDVTIGGASKGQESTSKDHSPPASRVPPVSMNGVSTSTPSVSSVKPPKSVESPTIATASESKKGKDGAPKVKPNSLEGFSEVTTSAPTKATANGKNGKVSGAAGTDVAAAESATAKKAGAQGTSNGIAKADKKNGSSGENGKNTAVDPAFKAAEVQLPSRRDEATVLSDSASQKRVGRAGYGVGVSKNSGNGTSDAAVSSQPTPPPQIPPSSSNGTNVATAPTSGSIFVVNKANMVELNVRASPSGTNGSRIAVPASVAAPHATNTAGAIGSSTPATATPPDGRSIKAAQHFLQQQHTGASVNGKVGGVVGGSASRPVPKPIGVIGSGSGGSALSPSPALPASVALALGGDSHVVPGMIPPRSSGQSIVRPQKFAPTGLGAGGTPGAASLGLSSLPIGAGRIAASGASLGSIVNGASGGVGPSSAAFSAFNAAATVGTRPTNAPVGLPASATIPNSNPAYSAFSGPVVGPSSAQQPFSGSSFFSGPSFSGGAGGGLGSGSLFPSTSSTWSRGTAASGAGGTNVFSQHSLFTSSMDDGTANSGGGDFNSSLFLFPFPSGNNSSVAGGSSDLGGSVFASDSVTNPLNLNSRGGLGSAHPR